MKPFPDPPAWYFHVMPEWLGIVCTALFWLAILGAFFLFGRWTERKRGEPKRQCFSCGLQYREGAMKHIQTGYHNRWLCKWCWRNGRTE